MGELERPRSEPQPDDAPAAIALMGDKPGNAKLIGEVAETAIEMLAQWCSQAETRRRLKSLHGVQVDPATVSRFARRHREVIEAKREEYLTDFMDTPLAWRKVRVNKLSAIYREAIGDMEAANEGDSTKAKTKSLFYALEALKLIREEMEPVEAQLGAGSTAEVDELIHSLEARLNPERATGQPGNK